MRHRSNLDLKQHLSRAEEAISDIYTWSASEAVLVFDPTGLPQPAAQPMRSAHMDLSCSSTAHLCGNVAGAVRGESTHLKRWSQLGPKPQRFYSSNVGTNTTQDRAVTNTEQRKSPGSGPSPSIPSPTSQQGDGCWHILRKGTTCVHVKSSFPTKGTGHTQTV